jgi:hypothetical protein
MHLQKFVDRVRGCEARGAKDLIISIQEAKDLHADITRLLITLQTLQDHQSKISTQPPIEVQITGGTFK